MTWPEALAAYDAHLRGLGRAASTRRTFSYLLGGFVRFCREQGAAGPAEVQSAHVNAWRQALSAAGHRESYVVVSLRTVRAFFRWRVRRGDLMVDPCRSLRIRQPPHPLHRLLTVEEAERLLTAPRGDTARALRARALLEVLYGVALRLGECRALDLTDVDLRARVLMVRHGKGGRVRVVPLPRRLAGVLREYLRRGRPGLHPQAGETAFFLTVDGHRMGCQAIQVLVNQLSRRVLGRCVGPHALRHACASHLLFGGADVREVQEVLGHAQVQTTQLYTHLQPTEVFREHRWTHPRARRCSDGPPPDAGERPGHPRRRPEARSDGE